MSKTSEDPKPPSHLRVTIDGETREIFMSFGLTNEIAHLVGGVEGIPDLSFNQTTAMAALELVLARRDKRGNILPPAEGEDPVVPYNLDPEVAEEILDWAGNHALDFFVRQFAKQAARFATKAGKLAEVGSSLTSSAS
ncbi:MAG: hypothetical protein DI590_05760 [Methylorubrum populi]|nr:MAG: hypothetical protein DI590_05760 [Methylorubrum populi]